MKRQDRGAFRSVGCLAVMVIALNLAAAVGFAQQQPTTAELAAQLTNGSPDERSAAIVELGRRPPAELRTVLVQLQQGASDSLEDVRYFSLLALLVSGLDLPLGAPRPVQNEAFAAALSDASMRVRAAAAGGLGASGIAPPSTQSALRAALDDPDGDVRKAAAMALGTIPGLDEASRSRLRELAQRDPEVRVRGAAAQALGNVGATEPQSIAALVAALGDPDRFVRQEAADSLEHLGLAASTYRQALVGLAQNETDDIVKPMLESILAGLDGTDADGDLIIDARDICPGGNDLVDSDGDKRPDACDHCPQDATNACTPASPPVGTVFLGLKNSDDQGTAFDLRMELYRNGSLVGQGQTLCLTGVTRNASLAKLASVSLDGSIPNLAPGDTLALKVRTRVGTNPDGTKCPGHTNALGLRLYYDAQNRAAGIQVPPQAQARFFLHTGGGVDLMNPVAPTASTAQFKDSAAISYANGNPWKDVGTWNARQP